MARRYPPAAFWVGIGLILLLEGLLALDVWGTPRGAVHTEGEIRALPVASGVWRVSARWAAVNFTALVWPAYLVLLDGVLVLQRGTSPSRARPRAFVAMCVASVPIWCLFDWVNFSFMHAWDYIGLPPSLVQRLIGYFIAFAAITPAMLMSGQVLMNAGTFAWARASRGPRLPWWTEGASVVAGVAMFVWPFLSRDPVANLTLWASLVFLIDPINQRIGRPGMWRDWRAGRFDRTLAAFAGGLTCGLLWEFWNYWALCKWVYHLPFLGPLERYKYFEMPAPGLLGFLPFGLECWVLWQLVRTPLERFLEPQPHKDTLI